MRLSADHDNSLAVEESLLDTTDLRSHSLIEDGTILTRAEDILHTSESRSAGTFMYLRCATILDISDSKPTDESTQSHSQ